MLLNKSEDYLPLHEVFMGHNTLSYLEEENGLSSDVENLGRLSKLGGLLQPKELSNNTMSLSNLKWLQPGFQQYSMAGQVLAAAECVPQVVQVGDKPNLQEEFMDFCISPLSPKVMAITDAISQIKDCLENEYR